MMAVFLTNQDIMSGCKMSHRKDIFNRAFRSGDLEYIDLCVKYSSFWYCYHNNIQFGSVLFNIGPEYMYSAISSCNNDIIEILATHKKLRKCVSWDVCIDLAFKTDREDVITVVLLSRFALSVDEEFYEKGLL